MGSPQDSGGERWARGNSATRRAVRRASEAVEAGRAASAGVRDATVAASASARDASSAIAAARRALGDAGALDADSDARLKAVAHAALASANVFNNTIVHVLAAAQSFDLAADALNAAAASPDGGAGDAAGRGACERHAGRLPRIGRI